MVTKVFRIEMTGGKDVEKDFISISKATVAMGKAIAKAKGELAALVSTKADPGAISNLTAKISELEAKYKSLSQQRKNAETDAKRQAEAEKLLADVKLKEAQATKALEQAELAKTQAQVAQEKELDRQIALEQKEQKELQKKKQVLDAQPGSYNSIKKAAQELYAVLKNAPPGAIFQANGKFFSYDEAIAEYKRLSAAEQEFRRQFTKDGTLVGEYASGIVDAFKRLNIDDIIKNQVNGAKQQLGELETKTQQLVVAYRQAQQQNITSTQALKTEINQLTVAYDHAKAQGVADLAALETKLKELQAAYHQAQQQGGQDLDKLQKEIHENVVETENLKKAVAGAEVQLRGIGGVGEQITGSINKGFKELKNSIGQFALTYVGFQAIFSGIQTGVDNAKELSDQTTNLEVELGKAAGGAQGLVGELGKLNTRTKLTVLEDIANIAAKAGVGEQQLVGVTQAIDKIKIAFGKDFGDVEQGTESLVKLINIFLGPGAVTGDNLLRMGNAIRTLANESVASVPFLNDFSKRMAGLKGITDISLPSVLGLASGFEQFGQSAETSSTALVKIVPKLAEDTEKFGKIAGVTKEEFSKLLKNNPAEALLKVSEGLIKGKGSLEEFAAAFKDTELGTGRVESVIGVLGKNTEQFRKSIDSAGRAFNDTSNIETAFAAKNENLSATLDKLGKRFADAANSKVFQYAITAIAGAILSLLNYIPVLIGLSALLGVNWLIQAVRLKTLTAATVENSFSLAFNRTMQLLLLPVAAALNIGLLILEGTYKLVTFAARTFSSALKGTPIGVILTGVILLGTAFASMAKSVKNANDNLERENAALRVFNELEAIARNNIAETISKEQQYLGVINNASLGLKAKQTALQGLIALNPEYLNGLNLENIATKEGVNLINAYNDSLLRKAQLEAAGARRTSAFQDLIKLTGLRQTLLQQTSGGTKEVQADKIDKDLKNFIDEEASNFMQRTGTKLRSITGAAIPKVFMDEVLKELDKRIGDQDELVKSIDVANGKIIKSIENSDKKQENALIELSSKNLGRAKGLEASIKEKLKSAQEGSEEYIKLTEALTQASLDVIQKREKLLSLLGKKESTTTQAQGETVFQTFDRLLNNNGTGADFKALLKKIQEQKKITAVTSKEYQELLTLEKKVRELIKPKAGSSGGSRSPEKQKLDDKLKEIEAGIIERKNALDAQFAEGLLSERDYYIRVRDNTTQGEQDKINIILEYQQKYKVALAKFNGDLIKDIAEAGRKQLAARREANQKLFEFENKLLEANLGNEQRAAERDRNTTLLNPNLSNEDTIQVNADYYDRLLLAQIVFNQRQITEQRKYGIKSIENEQRRKEAIEKIRKEIEANERQRPEAQQKDIKNDLDKELSRIKAKVANETLIILDSKKSYARKVRELNKIEQDATRDQLKAEADAAFKSLKIAKQNYDDKLISEKEYLDKLEDYKTKEAKLNGFTKKEEKLKLPSSAVTQGALQGVLSDAIGIDENSKESDLLGYAIAESFNFAKDAMNGYFDSQRQRIEQEKQDHLDALDREKERVKARATSKAEEDTIEREYAKKKRAVEKESGEQLKKSKKAEAKIALSTELANIAVAAAANPLNGVTLGAAGIAMYSILAALAFGRYVLRVGEINKQQFGFGGTLKKKEYGLGGKAGEVPVKGGIFGGKPHSQEGTDFSFNGQQYNAEVDEMNIIRTKGAPRDKVFSITGNHTQIASALNSLGGGVSFSPGAAVSKFSYGGQLGTKLRPPTFATGYHLNNINAAGQTTNDINDIQELKQMVADVTAAVYASDRKDVVLQPGKVTKAQDKAKKDVSIGTI
jgi:hypothetical protein